MEGGAKSESDVDDANEKLSNECLDEKKSADG
jgi:hypothetical protein